MAEIRTYMGNNKTLRKGGATKKVNKLIKNYVGAIRKANLTSNYSGAVGETLTALAGPQIMSIATKEVGEMVNQVIGTQHSQRIITNLSSEFVDMNALMEGKKYRLVDNDSIMITASAASEKIDVEIYQKNNKQEGIYASVKNYNAESIKKIPFKAQNALSLLGNENGDNLINHFLNLSTIKYTGTRKNVWDARQKSIAQYIRKVLLQKLISGEGTQTRNAETGQIGTMSSANVFVVLNSDTHEVNIYDMGDLLNQVQTDQRYVNYAGLLIEMDVIDNPLSYSSAKARITSILRPLMKPTYIEINMKDIKNG